MENIRQLLNAYSARTLSESQRQELEALLQDPAQADVIRNVMMELIGEEKPSASSPDWEERAASVLEMDKGVRVRRMPVFRHWSWAAAIVLFMLASGIYFWKDRPVQPASFATEIHALPGGIKATLTLADGSIITLDSSGNQVIRGGEAAVRQRGGQLFYDADNSVATYNTLTTPRGGMYRVQLPDGTLVWLNAASSLRYPTAFTGGERRVKLSGEAYFEVSKGKPFILETGTDEIAVLGTHFNVNAYEDEGSVRTTLLEGKIRIGNKVLQPGEQYVNGKVSVVSTEPVIAWVNGYFSFNMVELPEIMRQVARWYDIEVVYNGPVNKDKFSGSITRTANLGQLLKILEYSSVHFKQEGRKLIVLP